MISKNPATDFEQYPIILKVLWIILNESDFFISDAVSTAKLTNGGSCGKGSCEDFTFLDFIEIRHGIFTAGCQRQ